MDPMSIAALVGGAAKALQAAPSAASSGPAMLNGGNWVVSTGGSKASQSTTPEIADISHSWAIGGIVAALFVVAMLWKR